jgi:glycosyltransferase involved in cell wall biosynthesis
VSGTVERSSWPSFSVVIPTHGRPQLMRSAVQSILDQDYPGHVEVLVVFDREEPAAPDVTVGEGRSLRLLTNDRTPGPAGAYNVAALAAGGDYFALCDDDDEWVPQKLRRQIEAIDRHPGAVVGACGVYLGDGHTLTKNPTRIPKKEVLSMEDLLHAARNELHSSTFVVRRDVMLKDIGLIDEEIPGSYGEDYDWLLRAAKISPVIAVQQPLVRVRWSYSYFADRWQMIIDGLTYQLERRPELQKEPKNLARIYGRLAFAFAAVGKRQEARRWARRSLAVSWLQPRGYLAMLVSYRIMSAKFVLRMAHTAGRGV